MPCKPAIFAQQIYIHHFTTIYTTPRADIHGNRIYQNETPPPMQETSLMQSICTCPRPYPFLPTHQTKQGRQTHHHQHSEGEKDESEARRQTTAEHITRRQRQHCPEKRPEIRKTNRWHRKRHSHKLFISPARHQGAPHNRTGWTGAGMRRGPVTPGA